MATSPEPAAPVVADVPVSAAPAAVEAPMEAAPIAEAPAADVAPVAEPVVEVPAEEAPAEPAPEAEPAAVEGTETPAEPTAEAKPEAPAEPSFPTYEDWSLPEGLELQGEQTSALNNILGKHGLSQEAGQEIIDFGSSILRKAQENMAQAQIDAFADTRKGWVKDFEKSAGNKRNTILEDAKAAIHDAVPNEKARAELWNVLAFTGAGDHPAIINMLAAIGKRGREAKAPAPSINSHIQQSPANRRYGGR